MASYNRVELLGILTTEPEMRTSSNGENVCCFSVSITQEVMNLRNEPVVDTCNVDVETSGRVAELVNGYIHKGVMVCIEGRLRMERWIDRASGRNRSRLYVQAEVIQLLGDDGAGNQEMPPVPQEDEVPAEVLDMHFDDGSQVDMPY